MIAEHSTHYLPMSTLNKFTEHLKRYVSFLSEAMLTLVKIIVKGLVFFFNFFLYNIIEHPDSFDIVYLQYLKG